MVINEKNGSIVLTWKWSKPLKTRIIILSLGNKVPIVILLMKNENLTYLLIIISYIYQLVMEKYKKIFSVEKGSYFFFLEMRK